MNFVAAKVDIRARPLVRGPCLCRTGLSHMSSTECRPAPPSRKTGGYCWQESDNGRCRYLSLAVSRGFIALIPRRRIRGPLHWPVLRPSSGPKEVRHEAAQPLLPNGYFTSPHRRRTSTASQCGSVGPSPSLQRRSPSQSLSCCCSGELCRDRQLPLHPEGLQRNPTSPISESCHPCGTDDVNRHTVFGEVIARHPAACRCV
jgi:hypothetical protein